MYGLAPFFNFWDKFQGFDGRKSFLKKGESETLLEIVNNDVKILVQSNNIGF